MKAGSELEFNAKKYPKSIKGLETRVFDYSEKTIIRYTNVWKKLLKQYGLEDQVLVNPEYTLETVVNNLISEYGNNELRNSTFRHYRSALIHRMGVILSEQKRDGEKLVALPKLARLFESLKAVEATDDKKQPNRSSSSKLKYFPKDLYEFVLGSSFNLNRSNLGLMLKLFIEANTMIGLRPVEWQSLRLACDVEERCLSLVVDNAKNTQGRANGDIRILNMIEPDPIKLKNQLRAILGFKRLLDLELEARARKFLTERSRETNETYKIYIASKEPDSFEFEFIHWKGSQTVNCIEAVNCIKPENGTGETVNWISTENELEQNIEDRTNGALPSINGPDTVNGIKAIDGNNTVDGINAVAGIKGGGTNQAISTASTAPAPELTDFGFNSVAGEIQQTGRNTDHGKMAALLGAYNAVVIESYVDRYGTIQYALCQSVMDSLQRKLKDMSNEFYEKKKFGLPEELASNKANATIYSTRHQAVANRKKYKWKEEEVAGWFGHASVQTASRHYGVAGKGWGDKPMFRTSKFSLEKVRMREQQVNQTKQLTEEDVLNSVLSDKDLDDLL
ncbi:integrase [Acinetobacter baumannii]|uniref:integrase n=1 Tax=Acinetobacter baumannii TaxID=470 RepID=UPI00112771EE|nr:integrase [Acinetobacter baumannii]TPR74150.1 integrase [Acinetobacter baumannii]